MAIEVTERWPGRASGKSRVLVDRGLLFAGLTFIGFANGISHRVVAAVRDNPEQAFLTTFDIGAVAWIALFASIYLIARTGGGTASRTDLMAAGAALLAFLTPAAPFAWIALTCTAPYVALTSPKHSPQRRGAWILLALTVPLFWSRAAFALASDGLLRIDAVLASLLLGTPSRGNSIAFLDGWGYFWVAPPCSSLANVSLALLCWVLMTQALDRRDTGRLHGLRYCLLACAAVVAINVLRLVLTGISHRNYEILHGSLGSLAFGWLIFGITLAICFHGATREPRHATPAAG